MGWVEFAMVVFGKEDLEEKKEEVDQVEVFLQYLVTGVGYLQVVVLLQYLVAV